MEKTVKHRTFSNLSMFAGLLEALIPASLAAVAFGAFLYSIFGKGSASTVSDFIAMEMEVWNYILEYVRYFLLGFAIFGLGLGIFARIRREDGYESYVGLILCTVMAVYFLIH